MLGAYDTLVRRGGLYGIGLTLISQRPAVVNKNVLSQVEVLIVLQIVGPQDRDAIDDWAKGNGTKEQRDELLASLAILDQGETWFWSPAWLEAFSRVRIRTRETFNSSATPEVGQMREAPQRLARVDLAGLRERLTAVIKRAEQDDPTALRRQIAELERQLRERLAEIQIKRVEVPVFPADLAGRLLTQTDEIHRLGRTVMDYAETLADLIQEAGRPAQPETKNQESRIENQEARTENQKPKITEVQPPAAPASAGDGAVQLRAGERRMLDVLARRHPLKVTRAQLGTLAGFSPRGGTFGTYLSTLKRAGFLDEDRGEISATPAGLAYLGYIEAPPQQTTAQILAQWRGVLRAGERKMLDELVKIYPRWMTRQQLADRVGYEVSGGTFGTYLGTLRRNGLVESAGSEVRASPTLFLG